jgi:membrane protein implicated in regulation of membrane protease activity
MLELYLVALIVGAGLLLFSLFAGGDHEGHADAGGADGSLEGHGDADGGDVHGDAEHHGWELAAMSWLPFASVRFWTFFLAFFGATGTALFFVERDLGTWVTVAIAAAMGYVCGAVAVAAFRYMRRSQTSSSLGVDDYIGETAVVRVAVARGKAGKVRLEVKGRTVDLLAETEENEPFAISDRAMIYAVTERGHAIITRASERAV